MDIFNVAIGGSSKRVLLWGPVASNKTGMLAMGIRRVERQNLKVLTFVPETIAPNTEDMLIQTGRDGLAFMAHVYRTVQQATQMVINQKPDVVFIEEAQFVNSLSEFLDILDSLKIFSFMTALNCQFNGQPWPVIRDILHTTNVVQMPGVCHICKSTNALFSPCVDGTQMPVNAIAIDTEKSDSTDKYRPACARCFKEGQRHLAEVARHAARDAELAKEIPSTETTESSSTSSDMYSPPLQSTEADVIAHWQREDEKDRVAGVSRWAAWAKEREAEREEDEKTWAFAEGTYLSGTKDVRQKWKQWFESKSSNPEALASILSAQPGSVERPSAAVTPDEVVVIDAPEEAPCPDQDDAMPALAPDTPLSSSGEHVVARKASSTTDEDKEVHFETDQMGETTMHEGPQEVGEIFTTFNGHSIDVKDTPRHTDYNPTIVDRYNAMVERPTVPRPMMRGIMLKKREALLDAMDVGDFMDQAASRQSDYIVPAEVHVNQFSAPDEEFQNAAIKLRMQSHLIPNIRLDKITEPDSVLFTARRIIRQLMEKTWDHLSPTERLYLAHTARALKPDLLKPFSFGSETDPAFTAEQVAHMISMHKGYMHAAYWKTMTVDTVLHQTTKKQELESAAREYRVLRTLGRKLRRLPPSHVDMVKFNADLQRIESVVGDRTVPITLISASELEKMVEIMERNYRLYPPPYRHAEKRKNPYSKAEKAGAAMHAEMEKHFASNVNDPDVLLVKQLAVLMEARRKLRETPEARTVDVGGEKISAFMAERLEGFVQSAFVVGPPVTEAVVPSDTKLASTVDLDTEKGSVTEMVNKFFPTAKVAGGDTESVYLQFSPEDTEQLLKATKTLRSMTGTWTRTMAETIKAFATEVKASPSVNEDKSDDQVPDLVGSDDDMPHLELEPTTLPLNAEGFEEVD
jgi:thymidine kinase